jgi:hypothetical protein
LKIELGMRFGFLTTTGRKLVNSRWKWVVHCDCGEVRVVATSALYGNKRTTKSCGCQRKNLLRAAKTTHGCSVKNGTPEYRTFVAWQSMLWRCNNKARRDYKNYGGRGIRVCDRWQLFQNFLDDLGLRPDSHSLGRINNDGNYEPGNVQWESAKQQGRNRRSNKFIEHNGKRQTLIEWAEELGLSYMALKKRMENGWDATRALTTPAKLQKNSRGTWLAA